MSAILFRFTLLFRIFPILYTDLEERLRYITRPGQFHAPLPRPWPTMMVSSQLRSLPSHRLPILALLALAAAALFFSVGHSTAEADAPPAPGAVTNLNLKNSYDEHKRPKITATWTAPSPAPTGRYLVEIFESANTVQDPLTADDRVNFWEPKPGVTKSVYRALKPGTAYTVRVTARNENEDGVTAGTAVLFTTTASNAFIPRTAPDAPGAVTGLSVVTTSNSVEARWTAPDPQPKGGYFVELFEGRGTAGEAEDSMGLKGNRSKARFEGVKEGTTYTVRVTPYNKNKVGETDGPARTATGTTGYAPPPPVVPAAVTGLTLTKVGPGYKSVVVKWTERENKPTGKYRVKLFEGTTLVADVRVAPGTNRWRFNNMKADKQYKVEVTAHNKVGRTTSEVARASTPAPPSAPGAVTGLTLTVTSNSMSVTWTAPSTKPTGSYFIQLFETSDMANDGRTIDERRRKATKAQFCGLEPGTDFTVKVTAHNKNDGGVVAGPTVTATATTKASTEPGLPDTPTGVVVSADSKGAGYTLRVNWDAVEANNSDLTNYYIAVTELDSKGVRKKSVRHEVAGTLTTFGLGGAKFATEYLVKVRAVNGEGLSPWSRTVRFTEPAGG